jgi:hypothetical protein
MPMDLSYPTTNSAISVKPEALYDDELVYPDFDLNEELTPLRSSTSPPSYALPSPVAGPSSAGLIRCRGNGIMAVKSSQSSQSSRKLEAKRTGPKKVNPPDTIGAIKGVEVGAQWPKR